MREIIRAVARRAGFEFLNIKHPATSPSLPPDFSELDVSIYLKVRPFTLTTPERIYSLIRSVEHVVDRGIEGALVECGVWRGGSMMAAALALLDHGIQDRDIYLFDTYEGMSKSGEHDVGLDRETWEWTIAPLDEVRKNLYSTGYPSEKFKFVKGKVEETLPQQAPDKIAILRLDTDFYESTFHELVHLYPRLAVGGVLILDDYGSFPGAKRATDTYFKNTGTRPLLHRIDSDSRSATKI